MENRSHAFLAGLFVLGLGAALVVAVIWMGQRGKAPQLPYILVSHTSVGGLTVQAPVRFRGVEVGRVESVGFDQKDPGAIVIGVDVDARTPMTDTTYGRLTFQGVTGIPFVEIDDDGKPGRPLVTSREHPAQLDLRPSTLEEFGDAGQLLLVRVNDIAKSLNEILNKENARHFEGLLKGLEETTHKLARLQDGLQPVVARMPELEKTSEDVLHEIRNASQELGSLARELERRSAAIDQVGRGVEQVGMAASDVSSQTLPRLNSVLLRLERTSENLDRVIEAQARDPRGLLFGAAPPEPGPGEAGFDARTGGGR
jgi:phospholipid/cholesterol/gamma-HCH transport system substrate-binding protein